MKTNGLAHFRIINNSFLFERLLSRSKVLFQGLLAHRLLDFFKENLTQRRLTSASLFMSTTS